MTRRQSVLCQVFSATHPRVCVLGGDAQKGKEERNSSTKQKIENNCGKDGKEEEVARQKNSGMLGLGRDQKKAKNEGGKAAAGDVWTAEDGTRAGWNEVQVKKIAERKCTGECGELSRAVEPQSMEVARKLGRWRDHRES